MKRQQWVLAARKDADAEKASLVEQLAAAKASLQVMETECTEVKKETESLQRQQRDVEDKIDVSTLLSFAHQPTDGPSR